MDKMNRGFLVKKNGKIRVDHKKTLNRLLKYIGNIITILAIIMIVKKIYSYKDDYFNIFSRENIFFFIVIVLIYISLVMIGGIPWASIVNTLSGCNMHYSEVVFVYVKSNILKYIPGNIFQYVGRNELAITKNLKHTEVALATLTDIICYIFTGLLLSLLMAGNELKSWIIEQRFSFFNEKNIILCTVAFVAAIIIFFIYAWKKHTIIYMLSPVFSLKFVRTFILNCIFYTFLGMATAGLYIAVFSILLQNGFSLQEIITYTGLMQVALVIGFITPGSPAGVGVREAISLFLLKEMIPEPIILSGIVIMRVLAIIGDFSAYIILWLFQNIRKKTCV